MNSFADHLLLASCVDAITTHYGLYASLLLAGLLGGVTHCASMCGPFVAAQTMRRCELCPKACESLAGRAGLAALIPYHVGRLTTYMLLGIIAAFLSRQIIGQGAERWLSALLLAAAGGMFLLTSISGFRGRLTGATSGWWESWGRVLARLSKPFFISPIGFRGYTLGLLLGFIPCGLIFAALMAVSATRDMVSGALGMLTFGIGTIPALFLIGVGSQYAAAKWPLLLKKMIHWVMAINGISLVAMAGKIIW